MIDFQQELNDEQLKVVTNGDGPCLVLAGAGSGKTRTITYRVAYLSEQDVKPENILLVTFTNKAAREMLERVKVLTGGDIHLPWAGTFHHIGYRLLKKYATLIGYKNNFSVLDSEDSLDLIKLCLKNEGIDRKEKRFPSPAVVQAIISYARNSETTIADVLDLKYEHFLYISDIIVRIAEDYQKRKIAANVMDFDDLLVNWYMLLVKEQGVRSKLAEQFEYILVDEYQDTNKIQASIINLLASKHNNLLVVGDDAQSIYSFRAADIQNILAFEKKYSQAKIFKLETNYRSTPDILDLANDIIANNLKQYEKNLKAINTNFTKPELIAFASQAEEAQFIVQRIKELENEGIDLNKIAVLFRAAYHSQALEMELVKRGVDYDYRGGVRFFDRAHVKDVLAYLRIINNIADEVAWRRVLNMQIGIGPTWAERILSLIIQNPELANDLSHVGAQLPAKAQVGWNDFLQIYERLMLVENKNPGDLILAVLESKYTEYIENEYPDYRERLEDIKQLSLFSKNETELDKFLAEATLQENFRSLTPGQSLKEREEKIVLSTIHQAKGLEWEAVFVLGLSAGQFPNDRALRERDGIEEERRLFYVAVTRAKKYLYLTYSFGGGWGDSLAGPS
ncbi:MAG: ATP-dependent helicase, partial [Candidatus Magasanikiibacteriota bacterium]